MKSLYSTLRTGGSGAFHIAALLFPMPFEFSQAMGDKNKKTYQLFTSLVPKMTHIKLLIFHWQNIVTWPQ